MITAALETFLHVRKVSIVDNVRQERLNSIFHYLGKIFEKIPFLQLVFRDIG